MRQARGIFSRELDLRPLWHALRDHPADVICWLGVLLRVGVYLWNRQYWMDEGTLLGNLEGMRVLDFSGHLHGDQLAPVGFLIIERVIVGLLGDSGYATRFVPLVCGIVALWLFKSLAFRLLPFAAAMVALALFAFSDDLVYYSSELKPYSSDLALAMVVSLGLHHRRVRDRAFDRSLREALVDRHRPAGGNRPVLADQLRSGVPGIACALAPGDYDVCVLEFRLLAGTAGRPDRSDQAGRCAAGSLREPLESCRPRLPGPGGYPAGLAVVDRRVFPDPARPAGVLDPLATHPAGHCGGRLEEISLARPAHDRAGSGVLRDDRRGDAMASHQARPAGLRGGAGPASGLSLLDHLL